MSCTICRIRDFMQLRRHNSRALIAVQVVRRNRTRQRCPAGPDRCRNVCGSWSVTRVPGPYAVAACVADRGTAWMLQAAGLCCRAVEAAPAIQSNVNRRRTDLSDRSASGEEEGKGFIPVDILVGLPQAWVEWCELQNCSLQVTGTNHLPALLGGGKGVSR